MLIVIMITISLIMAYGIFGYFISDNPMIQEASFGAIVLSIGLMEMLKAALEMFENHRRDKVR